MPRKKAVYSLPLLALILSLVLQAFGNTASAEAKSLTDSLQAIPNIQRSLAMMTGTTINVPSQVPTIQQAINQASNGDTILVAPGTYAGGLTWTDKYLVLKSSGGAASTIIDGGGTTANLIVVNVPYTGGLLGQISGFTFRNGRGVPGNAGGITFYNRADILFENNIVTNNTNPNLVVGSPCYGATGGGIILNQNSNALLRNNTISNNRASGLGGGVYIIDNSNATLYNNTITGNSADPLNQTCNEFSAGGGIVVLNAAPRIVGNTLTSNTTLGQGGAISYGTNGAGYFEGNTVTNNTGAVGGGIEMETAGTGPIILNNTIANNIAINNAGYDAAGSGGGVAIYNKSTPLIKNNLIYGNQALRYGAGVVSSENANARLYSNKIYSNNLTANGIQFCGAGVYAAQSSIGLYNNLIYKNTAYVGAGVCFQDFANANLINNTIAYNNNRQDSTQQTGAWLGAGLQSINNITAGYIQNNIIAFNGNTANGGIAYQVFEQGKKLRLVANLITNTSGGMYFNYTTQALTSPATLNGNANTDATLNISGDPKFANAGSDNYDLAAASPAIDTGFNTNSPLEDLGNRGRPSGNNIVDIGSYEYYATPVVKTPIYRFYSPLFGRHFYTAFAGERNILVQNYMNYYFSYEGPAYDAYANAAGGTVPLYRFNNLVKGGHFYTISDVEKNNLINNYPNLYQYEGIAFYVLPPAQNCIKSVYRFFNPSSGYHFFTANTAERDNLINNYANIWAYEMIAYCVPYASS